jgi:hypothetical protein
MRSRSKAVPLPFGVVPNVIADGWDVVDVQVPPSLLP